MIEEMTSGECRWIGRPDLHVYCHAPAGREPRYCVVCPDEGLEYLPYDQWITATEAWRVVDRILAGKAQRMAG